jgi:hypothetical protein
LGVKWFFQLSFGIGEWGFIFESFALGSSMDNRSSINDPPSSPQKLALAQEAFERFRTRCFWFMRDDLRVGEEDVETIIRGLRAHGNREAFMIAARLCR